MGPDAPLHHLIDGPPEPPPGRDELAAIVRRSGRRRTQVLVTGVTVALLAGVGAGWVVGRSGHPASRQVTVGASKPSGASPAADAGPATAVAPGLAVGGSGTVAVSGASGSMTRAFVRTTADGVTIRAYANNLPKSMSADATAACVPSLPAVTLEVSTAAVAGEGAGLAPVGAASPGAGLVVDGGSFVLGLGEGAPVWVVSARTGSGVARVRMTFADGGTDEMAPAGGWVALARVAPASWSSQLGTSKTVAAPAVTGTLQALDASGRVLATVAVTNGAAPVTGIGKCAPPVPGTTGGTTPGAVNPGGAVTGSGPGSGSTSAGSGGSGGSGGSDGSSASGGSPTTAVAPTAVAPAMVAPAAVAPPSGAPAAG